MKQSDKIKELQKENKLLRENIELRKELIYDEDLSEPEKPKLEVGKWYKTKDWGNTNFGALIFITEFKESTVSGYGFNAIGWNNQSDLWSKKNLTIPATDKEVETALIKEAKKRGFKYCNWRFEYNELHATNGCVAGGWIGLGFSIFDDGKWAEIIKDKVPTIEGYEMEISGDIIKCGCVTSTKTMIKNLYKAINSFNKYSSEVIESFEIMSANVTIDELKEVFKYLNKKQ